MNSQQPWLLIHSLPTIKPIRNSSEEVEELAPESLLLAEALGVGDSWREKNHFSFGCGYFQVTHPPRLTQ